MSKKYTMTISRLTVDKLGVKLYDRVSAVIAEIVANSYDADANKVTILAPMGEWLATKSKGQVTGRDFSIEVRDTGCGMTVDEVNEFYLKVGKERRNDPKRGDVSKKYKRRVMGRKGVGKLAPFGVCKQIEVITAGGGKKEYTDESGKKQIGYEICHLILERDAILHDTDEAYFPKPGAQDGKHRADTGTTIRMVMFDYRRVPEIEDFDHRIGQSCYRIARRMQARLGSVELSAIFRSVQTVRPRFPSAARLPQQQTHGMPSIIQYRGLQMSH